MKDFKSEMNQNLFQQQFRHSILLFVINLKVGKMHNQWTPR